MPLALAIGVAVPIGTRIGNIVAPSAPVNTVAPAISGGTTPGSLLTATNGTWTGLPAPTFTYQWTAGGVDLVGATAITYTIAAPATTPGTVIRCNVTGSNIAGVVLGQASDTITVT